MISGQRGIRSNVKEGVQQILQIYRTGASSPDAV